MKEIEVGGGRGTVSVARLLHLETLINNINSTIHNIKGVGRKILEKKTCRHIFDTVGQFRMFWRESTFSQCVKYFFIFDLKIRKFDNKQMQGYT